MYLAPAGGFRGGTVGECRGKGRSLSCLPFRLSGPRASLVGRGWFSPTVTRFLCLTVFRPRLAHLAAAGSVVASLRSGRNARPRVARWYSRVVLRPPRPPPWQLCCRAAKLEMALSIARRSARSSSIDMSSRLFIVTSFRGSAGRADTRLITRSNAGQ